jgi:ectoine hydroxylase-related dioxygenase (phytanoyl-CoA dioxygenase family)
MSEIFSRDGFALVHDLLDPAACDALAAAAAACVSEAPGSREMLAQDWCGELAQRLRQHPAIAAIIPTSHVAVQCTYFEKSLAKNWLVPVHQDLSIPVRERVEHPELRGWSEKEGSLFVQPPVALLEELIAVRVHLDPCGESDGPLQFVPGTHRSGRLDAAQARALKHAGPVVSCALDKGGALMMRPLALHASSKASGSSRRRVLHFVFGPADLPCGLEWASPNPPVRPRPYR